MKKLLLSIIATFACMAMLAQNPVDRFLELYNQVTTAVHLEDEATSSEKASLDTMLDRLVDSFLSHYDDYKGYLLKPADRAKLENYFDIFQNFSSASLNASKFQELKDAIYNSARLGDIYKCLFRDTIEKREQGKFSSMQTYSFKDLSFTFPKNYTINESDTEFGVHLYIQDDDILSNSIFMDIDVMNSTSLSNASTQAKTDYLMEACQDYFVRYINDSYQVNSKSDFTPYPDDDLVIITLSGIAYGNPFTGEFISIFYQNYHITAFVTGSDSANEEKVFDYFLSFMD